MRSMLTYNISTKRPHSTEPPSHVSADRGHRSRSARLNWNFAEAAETSRGVEFLDRMARLAHGVADRPAAELPLRQSTSRTFAKPALASAPGIGLPMFGSENYGAKSVDNGTFLISNARNLWLIPP